MQVTLVSLEKLIDAIECEGYLLDTPVDIHVEREYDKTMYCEKIIATICNTDEEDFRFVLGTKIGYLEKY